MTELGRHSAGRRAALSISCAVAAALALPATASAAFDVTSLSIQPLPDATAGAHRDVKIDLAFTQYGTAGGQQARNLTMHLPAGLMGNPRATPTCSLAQFNADTCPRNTEVGATTASATATVLFLPTTQTVLGTIYNLQPAAGQPARLGAVIDVTVFGLPTGSTIKLPVDAALRPTDGGLDATIRDLPTNALGLTPLWLNSMSMTLYGTPGATPFMTNPTSCGAATLKVDATSYANASATRSAAFTPTGCGNVPFTPGHTIAADPAKRAAPAGYTIGLTVPDGDNSGGIRQAHVRSAKVVLPRGTTMSAPVANGLVACSDAQFGLADKAAAVSCPAASKVGTVRMATPLLATPVDGSVYFGEPRGGAFRLLVGVDDPRGVRLKLLGLATTDPATGQITTVFDDLPQVPFTSFALAFQGGDRAVLANPTACGTTQSTATLAPWSGTSAKTVTAPLTIGSGSGAACSAAPFRPSLAVSSTSTAAGRPAGALTMTISRPDGDQNLKRMVVDMPPGLAGSIAGATFCPDAQADAGTCPADTQVGTVTASVGGGGAPVPLQGKVFLTGPWQGSLIGLSIVLPGKVGPVDLGSVVTRAGIWFRSADGGLTVRTADLPQIVGGIPTPIQKLALSLDKPGFIVNPSSCALQAVKATIDSTDGSSAAVEAPYQATDCAGLPFAPRMSGTIAAKGPGKTPAKPAFKTVIDIPKGNSSSKKVQVKLPAALAVDAKRLLSTCLAAQRAAGTCPAASRVGSATAVSSLLPVPLTGPVYLAQIPGASLPGLHLELNGPVSLRLDGTVGLDVTGTTVTFDGIPDVPLERFELRFDEGAASPITVTDDLCKAKRPPGLVSQLTAHNGKRVTLTPPIDVTGCGATGAIKLRGLGGRKPSLALTLTTPPSAAPLRDVRLTLPRGLRAGTRSAVRRGAKARGDATRLKRPVAKGRAVTVTGAKARKVTVGLSHGALKVSAGLRRKLARHPRLTFKVVVTDAGGGRSTLRLRMKARR